MDEGLIKWLINKNYDYFYNFPLGGKFPDLIAIKEKELIAFEFKKRANEIPTAMGQCLFYLENANKAFIVIPKKEKELLSASAIETIKNQGIGLIVNNGSVEVLVNARNFRKNNVSIIEEIKKKKVGKTEKPHKNNVKERVIEVLKEHPEGLTTVDISKYIGMTRHSVTKYIYQLLGEGTISQREVGTAKLCYLKGKHARK